jgi:hypothetical protein
MKAELIELCRKHNLPTSGSKENLLEYVSNFIENKPVDRIKISKVKSDFEPAVGKMIDENYSNNEVHRAFFVMTIGTHFKFNVPFMQWMHENKGKKTYKEAIEKYNKTLAEKKAGEKTEIGQQCKYNQYTRDFFEDNPGLSRADCIKCWYYKKQQKGNHKYSKDDLKVLE